MATTLVSGRTKNILVEVGNAGGAGGMEGFRPISTTSTYRGWTVWQSRGGSWSATDGRKVSSGAAVSGMKSQAAVQAKIDSYLARQ